MHLLSLEHANQPQSLKKQSVDRQVKSDVTNVRVQTSVDFTGPTFVLGGCAETS